MDLRQIYTIVGCIYLGVLLAFASNEPHEKFDTISPSDDQLLLLKAESTTESLFMNAASNSEYEAGNEEDASGDGVPTTKQHNIDPSTILSSNHGFNLSAKQDDGSKPSSTNHNFIPATNSSTKHHSKNNEHTENPYLATNLSTKIPSRNIKDSENSPIKQPSHSTVSTVTMMTNHLGYSSDQLTQRSTKPHGSNMDTDPSQLSTRQHAFNDDPSTLESRRENDPAETKAKGDPVTLVITKPKVDLLNDFTVKPSSTLTHNIDTTRSSTNKKTFTSSIQGLLLRQYVHVKSASEYSIILSLRSLSSGENYKIRIISDQVENFSKTFLTNKKEFIFSSLFPGTLYKIFFSVVTLNSQSEEFKLENNTVPVAPQLNISRTETTSIKFSVKRNGTLCRNVQINAELRNHSKIAEVGGDCKLELERLCPRRKYSINVWQTQGVWKSQPRNVKFMTKEKPERFTEEVRGNTLIVKWEELKLVDCPIRGYKIYLNDGKQTIKGIVNMTEYSTTVHTGTTYSFQVQTIYSDGMGEISKPYLISISNKRPGLVESFELVHVKATTVQISLKPPKQTTGNVLGYLINTYGDKFCQTKIINCTGCIPKLKLSSFALPESCKKYICPTYSMNEVESLSRGFTIINLSPHHDYRTAVRAYNSEGCGNETRRLFTTLESTPSKVRDLQATLVKNNRIRLTYKRPEYENGIILNYTIQVCFKRHICSDALDNNERICNKFNTSENNYVLKNLESNWLYTLSVYAWTSKGFGNSSDQIHMKTSENVPSEVEDLEITKVTNTSLEFQWKRPCFPNGNITNYKVEYESGSGHEDFYLTEDLAGIWLKLHPYMMYTIKVSACTRIGCSKVQSVKNRTQVGIPMNVRNVKVKAISSTSVLVKWDNPEDLMGPTNYSVETYDDEKRLPGCHAKGFQSKECTVTGLDEYWFYSFKVTAYTSAGHSFPLGSRKVRTFESIPGFVTELDIGYKCYTRIYVKWEPPVPRERNGIIREYSVSLLEQNGLNQTRTANETHRYQEFAVKPEHNVTIQVRAITKIGDGPITERIINVPAGPPVIPDGILFRPAQFEAKDKSQQIAISLPMKFFSNDSNGQPVMWGLIVAQAEAVKGNNTPVQMNREDFHPKSMRRWKDVHENYIIQAYRPTTTNWKPSFYGGDKNSDYILGADKNCEKNDYYHYCNGYLQPGKSYRIKAFMCTRGGCSETRYSGIFKTEKDMSAVYISAPILLMIAIVSLAAVFFMWRKQLFCFQKHTIAVLSEVSPVHRMGETNKSFIMNLERMSRNISLEEFHEKVERMRKDSNLLFCEEFQLLRSASPSKSHSAAELQANRTKNRYTNILAFDHSRVKLLPLDDEEGSDYINANYMPGYQSKREYIAAQGPLPGTKDDFWRMIWEQNVSVVVMVTQVVERGRVKCEIYWPTGTDPVYFGDLVVQLRSESNLSDYVLRILDVQLGEQKREVKHFHFLKWPDFGCPANTSLLINFIQTVRSYMPYTATGPTIIHCSAGVGRTGTFIAIDWLLQHIREHQEVDIFGLILELRNYRVNMVQTEDQYRFIHQCIADHLTQVEESVEEDVFIDDTQM